MKKTCQYGIANCIIYVLCLYVNFLSVTGGLGGKSIRELSDKYTNLFTPSNQTFAIWSLIYLLLAISIIFQFNGKPNSRVMRTPLFIISCLFNGAWIVAWQLEFIGLSLLIMLGLLTTLALVNAQLKENGHGLLKITFGVYLGWICIATIANITTYLIALFPAIPVNIQLISTVVIIFVAVVLTSGIIAKLKNPFLALAVCWALYGIYTKRNGDYPAIAIASLIGIGLTGLVALIVFYRETLTTLIPPKN